MLPRKFKYIILDGLYPRICSEADTHREMAGFRTATSAGFAQLSIVPNGSDLEFDVHCYGESVSLRLKSKGAEDAAILRRMFCEPY